MKRKILILIIGILLVTTILAGDSLLNIWNKEKPIEKDIKDNLLNNTNFTEIKIKINIKCSDNECLYSAYQKGIINIKNGKIQKNIKYCKKEILTKEGWVGCKEWAIKQLTDEEIEDAISELVKNKLIKHAEGNINKIEYEDKSKGILNLK